MILTKNAAGTFEGFDYELWTQNEGEKAQMTLTGGGTFSCEWEALNCLFRTGKKLGSVSDYKHYGNMIIDYAAKTEITKGDVCYLGIYGWTVDPLMEFYVIDKHFAYKPPGGKGFVGKFEVDGGVYEVFVDTRVEQPSIQGTATFPQIFSVRTEMRDSGIITLHEHFKAWEKMGLDVGGNLYEIALCVEGYNTAGSAEVSKHVFTMQTL